jgi:hypothetical protein
VPTLLATTDQLKRRLHTAAGGAGAATDETLLDELLEEASRRMIELAPDRTLTPTPAAEADPPVERTFDVYSRVVNVPDLRVVVSMTLDGVALAAGDYRLRTPKGEGVDRRYLRVRLNSYGVPSGGDSSYFEPLGGVQPSELVIVGYWGPTEVESHVRGAALTWAARAWHARAARFADAVQDPAGGIAASYFRAVPADVATVLDDLQVPGL